MTMSLAKTKRRKSWLTRLMWLIIIWASGVALVGLLSVLIKLIMKFVGLSI